MKRTQEILMMLVLTTSLSVTAQTSMPSIPVRVDCAAGQSLNRTLAKLDKHAAATVSVNGTCTEYVQVIGFENLTLMDSKQEAFCDEHAEGEMIELQKPGFSH